MPLQTCRASVPVGVQMLDRWQAEHIEHRKPKCCDSAEHNQDSWGSWQQRSGVYHVEAALDMLTQVGSVLSLHVQ